MKKYKPNLIAEIGLNHLGNKKILNKYKSLLSKKKIDGITIQILKKSFFLKDKFKQFYLNKATHNEFFRSCSKKFKYVGLVTDDVNYILKTKKKYFNFIKILSKDVNNLKLIKCCEKIGIKTIYISTGLATNNNLFKICKKIDAQKINLLYTKFNNKKEKLNLKKISYLRKKFKLPVSYGNHSHDLKNIIKSINYKPHSIFFYVKTDDNKLNFPDNKHAVKLNDLDKLKNKINKALQYETIKL